MHKYTRSRYSYFLETLEARQLFSATPFLVHSSMDPLTAAAASQQAITPFVSNPNQSSNHGSVHVISYGDGTGLNATYYTGSDFTTPVFTSYNTPVNINWGKKAPDYALAGHSFGVRFTGQIEPISTETYTFFLKSKGAAQLYINGQLVVDRSATDTVADTRGTISLEAGVKYDIRVDYVGNASSTSSIQLLWSTSRVSKQVVSQKALYTASTVTLPASSGLTGQYYSDKNFTKPLITRLDSDVNFNWDKSGNRLLPPNTTLSVRWTGQITPTYSEDYTFYLNSDDGAVSG